MKLKTAQRRRGAKYAAESIDAMDPMKWLNGTVARFPDRFEMDSGKKQVWETGPDLATRARIVARRESGKHPLRRVLVMYTPRPPAAPYSRPRPFNVPRIATQKPKGQKANDKVE